jgi:hypothetical protein
MDYSSQNTLFSSLIIIEAGTEDKCILQTNCWYDNLKETGENNIKMDLQWMRRISTGFIWLRTETSCGFLRKKQWNFGFRADTSGGFSEKGNETLDSGLTPVAGLAEKAIKRRVPRNAGNYLTNLANSIFSSAIRSLELVSYSDAVFAVTPEPFYRPYTHRAHQSHKFIVTLE